MKGSGRMSRSAITRRWRRWLTTWTSSKRHVEKFGSVVTKQPDVWGQARLTAYRQEFETQMAAQLSAFSLTLQGSIAETDQAYFADALALSAAASPKGGVLGTRTAAASSSSSTTTPSTTTSATPSTVPLPATPDAFGAFDSLTRNPAICPRPCRSWRKRVSRSNRPCSSTNAAPVHQSSARIASNQRRGRHRRRARLLVESRPNPGFGVAGQIHRDRLRGRGDGHHAALSERRFVADNVS